MIESGYNEIVVRFMAGDDACKLVKVAWIKLKYIFIIIKNYSMYNTIDMLFQFTNKGSFWLDPSKLLNIEDSETWRDILKNYCTIIDILLQK